MRPMTKISAEKSDELSLFTRLPRETVWKIEIGPILRFHERADQD